MGAQPFVALCASDAVLHLLTTFAHCSQNSYTTILGFDARRANRPFLVFDFRVRWRSGLSARVPYSPKLKMVG